MSLSTAQVRLNNAMRDLLARWETTQMSWRDEVSTQFDEKHLKPLNAQVRSATDAIGQMAAFVASARRDCE